MDDSFLIHQPAHVNDSESFMVNYLQVSNLSHSNGKNHKGLVHMFLDLPHPLIIFSRYLLQPLSDLCLKSCTSGSISLFSSRFPYTDMDVEDDIGSPEKKRKEGEIITLPPFGLATYKMQGKLWVSGNGGRDQERLVSLLSVADSWLKQLMVQHHDFDYFTGIKGG